MPVLRCYRIQCFLPRAATKELASNWQQRNGTNHQLATLAQGISQQLAAMQWLQTISWQHWPERFSEVDHLVHEAGLFKLGDPPHEGRPLGVGLEDDPA